LVNSGVYKLTLTSYNKINMKKIILSVALLAAVGMTSCGKKSACDCKKEVTDLMGETAKAMGDAGKLKDIEGKMADLEKSCKDFKEEDFKDCK
jgi:hypothetical protein